ncbi:MAG: hypothetical protein RLZ98_774 [Pseudomonadota bacterium]
MTQDKPLRIIQISDTHLSATHAYFHENWCALLRALADQPVDFIVHTGDVSFNGAKSGSDIAYAREQLERLPAKWRAIPGNHDIGEAPAFSRLDQPIDEARIARWRGSFGAQWWAEDVGNWRLVGIDTALMASGRAEEREQQAFLDQSLASRGVRHAMVFTHMPPFVHEADDEAFTTSAIPHPARLDFLNRCVDAGVKTLACGHLHIHHTTSYRGMDIVWAPTTAMVSIEKQLNRLGRVPRPGYLAWELTDGVANPTFVNPEMMFMIDVTSYTRRHGGSTTKLPPKPLALPLPESD